MVPDANRSFASRSKRPYPDIDAPIPLTRSAFHIIAPALEITGLPNLRTKLPYEPLKDFVAITPFAINPFSLVTRPDFPAATAKELVALVRKEPGKFTYSSA